MDKDLLKKIQSDFSRIKGQNDRLTAIEKAAKEGKTTYKEVSEYAEGIGETLAKTYKANVTPKTVPDKFTREVAEQILSDPMKNNFNIVSEVALQTQDALNQAAGLHLKAVQPTRNVDRVDGLIEKLTSYEKTEQALWLLNEPVVNATQSISDDFVQANAGFQYKAGLSPKIVRTDAGGCCEWCSRLAGTYNYSDVKKGGNDVFKRHERCRCLVTYEPGDGRRQDVHTKTWKGDADPERIEKRLRNYKNHLQTDKDVDSIKKRIIYGETSGTALKTRFKTGEMDPDEYARASELWKCVKEIHIEDRKHIVEEFDNWLTEDEKKQAIVRKAVDNYWYTAVNKGHNQYKFYMKTPIEPDWMDEIMTEVIGPDWRRYE